MRIAGLCFLYALLPSMVFAELPDLEAAIAPVVKAIAAELPQGKLVIAVRSLSTQPWPVHVALSNELTLALSQLQREVISAATDTRIENLIDSRDEFDGKVGTRIKNVGADWLLAGELKSGKDAAELRLELCELASKKVTWKERITLSSESLTLAANIPVDNRKVLEFVQSKIGQQVDDGECSSLIAEGLKAAGVKRHGVYAWGRELDNQEQVMPGDILQLEDASLRDSGFSRSYAHHTAIVEEVQPDKLVILHQNVKPQGKIVHRDTWPLSANRTGLIVAYRPWKHEPLPLLTPIRRVAAKPVMRKSDIDLLHTIDPHLDRLRGLWYWKDGSLRVHREDYAKLQVPVDLPESYSVLLKIRRLSGDDNVGLGLVVGGVQTLLILDAYDSTISGLHLVDGKSVKSNATTFSSSKPVLPKDVDVTIRVEVSPNSVHVQAGDQEIVKWSGQPSQFSMDDRYAVPRKDWIFLAGKNTNYAVSEFWLTANGKK